MNDAGAAFALSRIVPTVTVTSGDGTIVAAYGGMGRPLGYEPDELIGKHSLELIASEDQARAIAMFDPMSIPPAASDIPLAPFSLHLVAADGSVDLWDVLPTSRGTAEGGFVNVMTRRVDQGAVVPALTTYAGGGEAIDMVRMMLGQAHRRSRGVWGINLLLRRSWITTTMGPDDAWTVEAGPSCEWAAAAMRPHLSDAAAPWNQLEQGELRAVESLPGDLSARMSEAGFPHGRVGGVDLDGTNRLCIVQFSRFPHVAEANSQQAHAETRDLLRRVMREERNAELLTAQAQIDSLTGLANRHALMQAIDENEFTGPSTVHFIDLDRFKAINDQHGHAAGDAALCRVAEFLLKVCRPDDFVCRLGGDEFLVITDQPSDIDETFASRLRRALDEPLVVSSGEVQLSVTVGTAFAPTGHDIGRAVDEADERMLQGKRRRRALQPS